jgi:DnaK suppressor protein
MTKTELEGFRQRLNEMRDRLAGDVNHLADEALHQAIDETSGSSSHVPIHMADLGTDNFERENTLQLMANERQMLEEIGAALERLDQGTFGKCEECAGSIVPKARLKEIPYTRYCVACANKLQQHK